MELKSLQINLGKGRQTQDLLMQTVQEKRIDIAIISEQYRKPVSGTWYQDLSGKSALYVANPDLEIRRVEEKNKGFVWIEVGSLRIYSCYFSPNDPFHTFETEVHNLEDDIRTATGEVLIAGDFNAKSSEWESSRSDRRGSLVTDMVARRNLTVLNNGGVATYERYNSRSVIDLTLSSRKTAGQIHDWTVLEDVSLSDHNYIEFGIQNKTQRIKVREKKLKPSWNVKKLDQKALEEFLKEQAILDELNWTKGPGNKLLGLTINTVKEACNQSMPKRSNTNPTRKPMYWWTDEISELREKCKRTRRQYTRSKGSQTLREALRQCRQELKHAINNSKNLCWTELLKEIDNDPWGKPYQIVTKKLNCRRKSPGLDDPTWVIQILKNLFPSHQKPSIEQCQPCKITEDQMFSPEELQKVCSTLKNKKAPGLDGVHNEILKTVAKVHPQLLLKAYNRCLKENVFPSVWKKQKLALFLKGSKPQHEPTSYRPICLLDTMGKVFEGLILQRLQTWLEETHGLSEMQYGFRKCRSTVDAIKTVVEKAREAKEGAKKEFCALVTLDIRNAFNSAKWEEIIKALIEKNTPEYLISMIRSYLSDRKTIYEGAGEPMEIEMTCGVPQGSKLGPVLWNIMYDSLLGIKLPQNVSIVGFADDAIIVATAETSALLEVIVNDTLRRVMKWLTSKGLEVAAHKTEALLITERRSYSNPTFLIGKEKIQCGKSLRYLGMEIDRKLSFGPHISETTEKALKIAASLSRLMPNTRGPSDKTRRILMSVMHSKMLYAAPIWAEALQNNNLRRKMQSVQRKGALRITSAYRTVSGSAVLLLANVPPIDLLALERKEVYNYSHEQEGNGRRMQQDKDSAIKKAKENVMHRWQKRWDREETGRWTHRLIPNISKWISRKHGSMTYHLTQAFTGHGCFKAYLKRFGKTEDAVCFYCSHEVDDAEHTLFHCPRWDTLRHRMIWEVGCNVSPENMVTLMICNKAKWTAIEKYITAILKKKEEDERNQS